MTPIPLLIGFIIKKCFGKKHETVENQDPVFESMIKYKENEVIATPFNSKNENQQA